MVVGIDLTIAGAVLVNGGDDDVDRGTRIHWFDSKLGITDDSVPSPYTPIEVTTTDQQAVVEMLGKQIQIGATGLPTQLLVTQDKARVAPLSAASQRAVLGQAVTFELDGVDLTKSTLKVSTASNMSVGWTSVTTDSKGAAEVSVVGVSRRAVPTTPPFPWMCLGERERDWAVVAECRLHGLPAVQHHRHCKVSTRHGGGAVDGTKQSRYSVLCDGSGTAWRSYEQLGRGIRHSQRLKQLAGV